MSDKLTVLKNQAKQSMQLMADNAMLHDAASDYKRLLFKSSYRYIVVSLGVFMFSVCAYKSPEVESVKRSFGTGFAIFFNTNSRSYRELYAPEVYEEDAKYRRKEANMFRDE